MVFNIKNKVALITGGASGLGLFYAKDLLRNGLRAVTLADVNEKFAETALQEIEAEFGSNKAIFVKTDVTSYEQVENAFKKTVETFTNIDIVINNAGIMNDAIWEKEVAININGTIYGILLGLEKYIPQYKTNKDEEGLIVNISSIAGVYPFGVLPVYIGTKFAVHGMTLSFGSSDHYEHYNVRVVGICPGKTDTALLKDLENKMLGEQYKKALHEIIPIPMQTPEQCSQGMMEIIKKAPSGTVWIVEGGETPYQFILPDRFNLKEKVYL